MPEDEDAAEGPVEDGARGGQCQERLDGQIVMEQREALVECDHGRPSDAHHRAHHLGHPMPPAQSTCSSLHNIKVCSSVNTASILDYLIMLKIEGSMTCHACVRTG